MKETELLDGLSLYLSFYETFINYDEDTRTKVLSKIQRVVGLSLDSNPDLTTFTSKLENDTLRFKYLYHHNKGSFIFSRQKVIISCKNRILMSGVDDEWTEQYLELSIEPDRVNYKVYPRQLKEEFTAKRIFGNFIKYLKRPLVHTNLETSGYRGFSPVFTPGQLKPDSQAAPKNTSESKSTPSAKHEQYMRVLYAFFPIFKQLDKASQDSFNPNISSAILEGYALVDSLPITMTRKQDATTLSFEYAFEDRRGVQCSGTITFSEKKIHIYQQRNAEQKILLIQNGQVIFDVPRETPSHYMERTAKTFLIETAEIYEGLLYQIYRLTSNKMHLTKLPIFENENPPFEIFAPNHFMQRYPLFVGIVRQNDNRKIINEFQSNMNTFFKHNDAETTYFDQCTEDEFCLAYKRLDALSKLAYVGIFICSNAQALIKEISPHSPQADGNYVYRTRQVRVENSTVYYQVEPSTQDDLAEAKRFFTTFAQVFTISDFQSNVQTSPLSEIKFQMEEKAPVSNIEAKGGDERYQPGPKTCSEVEQLRFIRDFKIFLNLIPNPQVSLVHAGGVFKAIGIEGIMSTLLRYPALLKAITINEVLNDGRSRTRITFPLEKIPEAEQENLRNLLFEFHREGNFDWKSKILCLVDLHVNGKASPKFEALKTFCASQGTIGISPTPLSA